MLRLSLSARSVVPPPFLYGIRNPLVSGVIRFNEDISSESKKVLMNEFFNRDNPFVDEIDTDSIEIVSDDTLPRAHDRNHVEAGAAVLIKTSMSLPTGSTVPCAITWRFVGVGANNDCHLFHSNQARVIGEFYGKKFIGDRGVVLTVHPVESGEVSLSEGHDVVNEILESQLSTNFPIPAYLTVEELPIPERCAIYTPYIHFPSVLASQHLRSFALIDSKTDAILCGFNAVSLAGRTVATDAYVTSDCEIGSERAMIETLASKVAQLTRARRIALRFSKTDTMLGPLFDSAEVKAVISGVPLGLTWQEQQAVLRAPWITSGLI